MRILPLLSSKPKINYHKSGVPKELSHFGIKKGFRSDGKTSYLSTPFEKIIYTYNSDGTLKNTLYTYKPGMLFKKFRTILAKRIFKKF